MPKKKKGRNSLFRRYGWPAAAVLIILLIAGGFYWHDHKSNGSNAVQPIARANHKIDYSPGTKADNAPNNDRKGSSSPSSTLENYQPPPNTGSFSVTITRAGVEGSNLQVAAITRGVSTGTCTLNVHQTGESTVTKSEPLSLQVNSYVCQAMSLPLSDFPNQGQWNVSMTVESNGQTVTSDWSQNPVTL